MLAENKTLSTTNEILMLSSQYDMASAASAVLNRNNYTVFFVAQKTLIDLKYALISGSGQAVALLFEG